MGNTEVVILSFLLIASAFDIYKAKFPNWLFVSSSIVFIFISFYQFSLPVAGLHILFSIGLFILLTPLFFIGAFGAGDIKLLLSLSLACGWFSTINIFIYALFWGLTIGLIKLALTHFDSKHYHPTQKKVPFAVALLMGGMSLISSGSIL